MYITFKYEYKSAKLCDNAPRALDAVFTKVVSVHCVPITQTRLVAKCGPGLEGPNVQPHMSDIMQRLSFRAN